MAMIAITVLIAEQTNQKKEDKMTKVQDFSEANKYDMKQDYLKGDTLNEITKKYGLKDRSSIYYYINPLTPEEKAEHVRNRARREQEAKSGQQQT